MSGHGSLAGQAYPANSITGLIGTTLMTPITSAVLRRRLEPVAEPAAPLLDAGQLAVLSAVAARLIPQGDREPPIDLAAALHHRLSKGDGDGWRYADLPPDGETVARGLLALDASAVAVSRHSFAALDGAKQDELLREVQFGRAVGPCWAGISPARWFEELLAALVDVYYAHPLAQEEIGYLGMADARGWQAVGLNARAAHEPEPLADAPAGLFNAPLQPSNLAPLRVLVSGKKES